MEWNAQSNRHGGKPCPARPCWCATDKNGLKLRRKAGPSTARDLSPAEDHASLGMTEMGGCLTAALLAADFRWLQDIHGQLGFQVYELCLQHELSRFFRTKLVIVSFPGRELLLSFARFAVKRRQVGAVL